MAEETRRCGWTFVVIKPGELRRYDLFGPLTPAPGSIGVKQLRGEDVWGCWTPWNGHWWDVPRCLLRLYHKAGVVDTITETPPV